MNGQTLHEGDELSIDGSTGEVIFARVPTTDSEGGRVLAGKLPAPAQSGGKFFSSGTSDLTQLTFGFSRDDATRFLHRYVEERVLPRDPFVSLDRNGVGELMRLAAERGRQTRPDLKLGICGEHGGEPASVSLCQSLGLSCVSCSPFRVPIARLAAAQAALEAGRAETSNAGGALGVAPGVERSAGQGITGAFRGCRG
ncbi:MAG TPA: putative PEP-binding protein [Myxococcaceae bacterium]|nr:putative PEP-binding protein [Myxococcaceae bacterium]